MVLFAFLALLIVGAIAYFRDPKTFNDRSNIPLLAITVAVTTVLIITVNEPFGRKLLIFFSVLGTWSLATEIMKFVGDKPEAPTAMRAFAGGHIDNDRDETTGSWIVRVIVLLAAGAFVWYGYGSAPDNCNECLYYELRDNAMSHVGSIMFLSCCAFFVVIWNLADKFIGITSSWPAKIAAVVGALGIILIYA